MAEKQIMLMGVGCTLYSDEGFGVRVIERMQELYEFLASSIQASDRDLDRDHQRPQRRRPPAGRRESDGA